MGFIIIALSDPKKSLHVNFWNWRPTVELVRSFEVIEQKRVELMHMQCVGTVISENEARQIAEKLRHGVLVKLQNHERVKLDLTTTSEPDDGKLYRGADEEKNYSATFEWLTSFAHFCAECRGFKVL